MPRGDLPDLADFLGHNPHFRPKSTEDGLLFRLVYKESPTANAVGFRQLIQPIQAAAVSKD